MLRTYAVNVVLPCTFSQSYSQYICTIKSANVLENVNVIRISGTHLAGYGNENVTQVEFQKSKLKKLPQILFDTFSNLEMMVAYSVSMTDLDGFANCSRLKDLRLQGNLIETIKNSTFEECGNLENIVLFANRLTHLELDAFEGLNKLSSLSLCNNENFLSAPQSSNCQY